MDADPSPRGGPAGPLAPPSAAPHGVPSLSAFLSSRPDLPHRLTARLLAYATESAGGPDVDDGQGEGEEGAAVAAMAAATVSTPPPLRRSARVAAATPAPPAAAPAAPPARPTRPPPTPAPTPPLPPHDFPLAILADPLIDEATSTAACAEVAALLASQGSAGRVALPRDDAAGRVRAGVRGDTAAWISTRGSSAADVAAHARALGCPALAAALDAWLPAAVAAMVAAGTVGPRQAASLSLAVQATCYPPGSAGYARHIDSGRAGVGVVGRLGSSALYLGPRASEVMAGAGARRREVGQLAVWPATGGGLRMSAAKRRRLQGGGGGAAVAAAAAPPPGSIAALGPCLEVLPKGGRALAWAADMHHAVRPVGRGEAPRYALSAFFLRGGAGRGQEE